MDLINLDRVNNADPAVVANLGYAALDGINKKSTRPPEEQLLGLACMLRAFTETLGVDIPDLMQASDNIMKHADGTYVPEFRAMRRFAREEFINKE